MLQNKSNILNFVLGVDKLVRFGAFKMSCLWFLSFKVEQGDNSKYGVLPTPLQLLREKTFAYFCGSAWKVCLPIT